MSNVTLHIGGRSFTVACGAGEEAHITALGKMIEAKVHAMGPAAASQNEGRMLLFAALMLADELDEARRGIAPPPPPPLPSEDPELAEKLDAIALKLEMCATTLERAADEA